jgi:hypothetical protein
VTNFEHWRRGLTPEYVKKLFVNTIPCEVCPAYEYCKTVAETKCSVNFTDWCKQQRKRGQA